MLIVLAGGPVTAPLEAGLGEDIVLFVNQALAGHFLRLLQTHDVEHGGSHVGQDAAAHRPKRNSMDTRNL